MTPRRKAIVAADAAAETASRRLGREQIAQLVQIASPATMLVEANGVTRSLERRGLVRAGGIEGRTDLRGGYVVTPAGLRALAAALEAGRVTDTVEFLALQRQARARREAEAKRLKAIMRADDLMRRELQS